MLKLIRKDVAAMFMVFFLMLSWSIWYWASFPRTFKSPSEINKWCMDPDRPESEYCFGYSDGWRYGLEMALLQRNIEEFEELTSEQIWEIDEIMNQ